MPSCIKYIYHEILKFHDIFMINFKIFKHWIRMCIPRNLAIVLITRFCRIRLVL